MTTDSTSIDITHMPDLVRIAEEVEATKKPRRLTRDRKTVAILMPAPSKATPKKKRAKTKANYEAFLSAAGSWKDVDTDTLLKHIYNDRHRTNTHPPVKL